MTDQPPPTGDATAAGPGGPTGEPPSGAARAAIAEEMVLNAAVAYAGQVVNGAQQAAEQAYTATGGEQVPLALRHLIVRQFWLETATLCLRRLGESYGDSQSDAGQSRNAELLADGARRADEARIAVEALGDLGLDLLDRLLDS